MQVISQLIENGRLALRLMNDPRVPTWVRYGIPILVVLYIILPIDVIPDFIPGVGQVDDLTVVLLGMSMMSRLAPAHVVEEHQRALGYNVPPRSGSQGGQGSSSTGGTTSGSYWSTPPSRNGGQATRRVSGEQGSIDGEYKVVGDGHSG